MQHLNEEELVLHRYRDDANDAAAAEQHLNTCGECRARYDTLCRVLALVDDLPVPQRGDEYGTEVWNHLRWRLGHRERARLWQALAAAAMIAFRLSSLLGLAAILDVAEPGDRIFFCSYGSGAGSDAFAFRVTDHIRDRRQGLSVGDYLDRGQRVDGYGHYLKLRGKIKRS